MNSNRLPPQAQLMQYLVGKWISKPIYVAAELCIADMLADGPKDLTELARASQSHAPFLYRVLRALASVGIFAENDDKKFELTPMAELLKSDAMRSIALMFNSDWSDQAWLFFLDSVKTGDTAFEKAHGLPVSDWLEKNPNAAEIFNKANAIKATRSHRAIIDAYDFTGIQKLTDVGGGLGVLMIEILKAYPHINGAIADLPFVIPESKNIIQQHGFAGRCDVVECDFFEEIPSGSDAYLLSNILHDWSDEKCQIILNKCREAMMTDSRLLVVEMIIPPGNEPSISKLLDLEMMVTTGGRERTKQEFKDLFEISGFRLAQIISSDENVFILEGKPK